MTDLTGETALVTGAARRIGAAIAQALAEAGAGVVVHCHRSAEAGKRLVADLRKSGHEAWLIKANLAKKQVEHLVPDAAKLAGRPLTLLVNNASTYPSIRVKDLTWGQLEASVRTDAWAPLLLTRQLHAQLPAGREGAVVNLLDARLVDDDRAHAGYWLAKRMLADVTRLCALEFAPRLRVNGVAPGPTLGPDGDEASLSDLAARLPLGRTPTSDDVAQSVVHLLAAAATTGQTLYVDGGRHLGRAAGAAAKPHQRTRP